MGLEHGKLDAVPVGLTAAAEEYFRSRPILLQLLLQNHRRGEWGEVGNYGWLHNQHCIKQGTGTLVSRWEQGDDIVTIATNSAWSRTTVHVKKRRE